MTKKILSIIIIITANSLYGQECVCYNYIGSRADSINETQDVKVAGYMLDSSEKKYLDLRKSLESKFLELIQLSQSSEFSKAKLLFDFEVTESEITFYGHLVSKQLIGVICNPNDIKSLTAIFLVNLNDNVGAYPINFNISGENIFFTKTNLMIDSNSLLFKIIYDVGLGAEVDHIVEKCDKQLISE